MAGRNRRRIGGGAVAQTAPLAAKEKIVDYREQRRSRITVVFGTLFRSQS